MSEIGKFLDAIFELIGIVTCLYCSFMLTGHLFGFFELKQERLLRITAWMAMGLWWQKSAWRDEPETKATPAAVLSKEPTP